jgi:hypothetical protein
VKPPRLCSTGLIGGVVEGVEGRLGEFVENAQKRLHRGIGLAVAVLPIAQGRERDAEFPRELPPGEPELAANDANIQQWREPLGRRRQIRVLGDHPLDIGVGEAVEFLGVKIALLRVRLLQRLSDGHQNLSFERAGLAGKTRGCPVPQADCWIAQRLLAVVFTGLVPVIHAFLHPLDPGTWMPGPSQTKSGHDNVRGSKYF